MQKFNLTTEYLGYQNGPEETSVDSRYFIAGTKNVLIDTGRKSYTSRTGMRVLGAVGTGTLGTKGYHEWKTAKKLYHLIRSHDRYLEVYFNDTWIQLMTDLSSAEVYFAEVFDSTQKTDILCFVNGESKIKNWGGGAALCRAVTAGATTITLQGSYTAATIAFVDGGASPDTITDSANGFVTAGFAAGDVISVSGTTNNNRSYTIATVAAGTLTLIPNDIVTTEAAGASVTIHNGYATWGARGFLTSGTRKIIIAGTEYAYTGGEGTDTLTGVDALPTLAAGTAVLQAVRSNNNASPITTGYTNDYIGSARNQIYIGSKTSRLVFGSKTSDYTDFAYTANRLVGEGVEVNLDTFCTGFEGTKDEITIFGGHDDIYTVAFQLSSDNAKEAVNIKKLDTAPGQGLISPHAKTRIKNAIAFITNEPTLDTLGNVENVSSPQNVPVSDLIKNDFDSYDFTGACLKYWKRNIVISIPAESKVLLYDLRYSMWQPPQEFAQAIGGLSIDENGNLIGHSYSSNESYTLFTGLSDEVGELVSGSNDGFSIEAIARHFSNDGKPDQRKVFDIFHVNMYVSAGISMEHRLYYETDGQRGTAQKTIDALTDRFLFGVSDINPLGKNSLGSRPLGGGGLEDASGLLRYRRNLTYPENGGYYEITSEFYNNSATEQFTMVLFGSNATTLDTEDSDISD